jgi:hypothetical protein
MQERLKSSAQNRIQSRDFCFGRKGKKTDGFGYSDSYEEDCDHIERKAEYVIKIQSMPTSSIKKYWDEIDSSSYNLFFYNCSTVVANALLEGFDEYLELRSFNQFQINLLNTLLRIEYTIQWPDKVKKLARDLKRVMD